MISIQERVEAFHKLGDHLRNLSNEETQTLALNSRNENPWFTEENVGLALNGISSFLKRDVLVKWIGKYILSTEPKKVGLVLAGNIPLVGFHDFLTVLIAGHVAMVKASSKDSALLKYLVGRLITLEPRFQEQILFVDLLKNFDAVIATGSDNSARYFDYYFGKYPHIIRKNRTSVAVLDGKETDEELKALGKDVFSYFGLGCRNVSKLFVPKDYNFDELFQSWEGFRNIIHHHKYCNNYDYQKSILLVNRATFLDNGFVLLQESDKIVSPISVLYYETYNNPSHLKEKLDLTKEKIQCVVGKIQPANVALGKAQCPAIDDYADNIDTLRFLSQLK